jgi:hypothetical protein
MHAILYSVKTITGSRPIIPSHKKSEMAKLIRPRPGSLACQHIIKSTDLAEFYSLKIDDIIMN